MTAIRLFQRFCTSFEAADWAGDRTVELAWIECERGDWLLEVAYGLGLHRDATLAVCDIAELVLERHWRFADDRPATAIAVARTVVMEPREGNAEAALAAASDASWSVRETAAAWAAACAAVGAAVADAGDAVNAARAAVLAAADAGWAATAAEAPARAAAAADSLRESAEVVRKHISLGQVKAAVAALEAETEESVP